ncbi:MAG: nucleotidyltransferase family protein, partial [Armatimonadota bacterium]
SFGVRIEYSLEDTPRGTAGGMRRLQPLLDETFVVMSGDAVTDFNLSSAIDFHRRRSAIATLLTYSVEDPTQFGIVHSEGDGLIMRFQEKPKAHEVFCNTVNTGIYVLEPEVISYIPHETVYDFSKNVFPRLLQNQEPFYSCRAEGYWCDVGNLAQYRNAHFDALTGRVRLDIPAASVADGIWIGDGAQIHSSVQLMAPLYIGSGAHVGRGSILGRYAVIGDHSNVDEGSRVIHSVLDRGAQLGSGSDVYGSIVGTGYALPDGRSLADEIVVSGGLRGEIGETIGAFSGPAWPAADALRLPDAVAA